MKIVKQAPLLVALLALSCTNRPLTKVEPSTESYVIEKFNQTAFKGVDILVVVDNSISMGEEQENLTEEFPQLIRALLDPPLDGEGKPEYPPALDLHIGVVSTDMGAGGYSVQTCDGPASGDDGVLLHDPAPGMDGCSSAYASYLTYPSDEPDDGLIQQMATDFGCIATLGTDGCGFEQQLEAGLKALAVNALPGGPNSGFLREDAILLVLFVTDEDDCSVSDNVIFDEARTDLGHINMRCFYHPEMIHPIQRYVDGFRALKPDWENRLLLGFITGVPMVPECEGSGDDLLACLSREDMVPTPDPENPDRLTPSCYTDNGKAFPPVRLVELAMEFGPNALVQSICTDDFGPAIEHLTDKLTDKIGMLCTGRELEIEKVEGDECACQASCTIIEEMPDVRPCPEGRTCFEPDGPGTGCAVREDEDGYRHTLCIIPQAPTRLDSCDLSCSDPAANLAPQGEGWYYLPYSETGCPEVIFSDSMVPIDGAGVYIQCESMICPDNRQCGPADFPNAVCCNDSSYCDRDAPGGPTCLPRPQ